MKKFLVLFVLCLVFALPAAAAELSIAAIINDEAISNTDVEGRMRLALLGTGIQPSAEVISRLKGQVLRAMIDERLQLQEAAKLGISVEESEIDAEVAKMAQQNNMPPVQLPAFFAQQGIPVEALRSQIRASISWAKVVQRKLRPKVNIGDDEVDAEIARLQATAGQPEYLVADIFLPVDNPQQEAGVRQTAGRLIEQMARGARFSAIARQFSQSSTAPSGGDLGWIRMGQLEPQLDVALVKMNPGTVSPPVRTATGFHILMLRETRTGVGGAAATAPAGENTLTLRQVVVKGTATPESASKIEQLRSQAKSCADMERLAKEQGDEKGGDLGTVRFATLPEALKPMLANLPVNQPSPALRNDNGVLFVMVCARSAPSAVPAAAPAAAIDREKVTDALGLQKLELLARRYMRDLRQDAFIDIRG